MSLSTSRFESFPFREAGFRRPSVEVETRADGELRLKSVHALPARPGCTVDWLARWGERNPDHPMLVERDADGQWQTLSRNQVWNAVRSIASVLLQLGASQER